jgi:hypothetical protein
MIITQFDKGFRAKNSILTLFYTVIGAMILTQFDMAFKAKVQY